MYYNDSKHTATFMKVTQSLSIYILQLQLVDNNALIFIDPPCIIQLSSHKIKV